MSFLSPGAARYAAALFLVAVAWVLPPPLQAAPAISLNEAVRRAVDRAPLIAARQSQVVSAQQDSRRAGALPDPMLSVGLQNLPVTGSPAFDLSADEMTMKTVGLRQDIPARAKRQAERTLATRRVDAAQAATDSQRQDTRRAVAMAWIDLWAAQRQGDALARVREQAALAAGIAHARVRSGADSASEALAADAEVLDLDNRIAGNQTDVRMAQAALQRWLGDADAATTPDAPDFTQLPYPPAHLQAAIDRLPALRPSAAQVETAAAQIDLARAQRHPDWSIEATYGQRSGGRSDMLSVQVGIGLPLFPGERQDRDVAARQADYQAALDVHEDARRQQSAQLQADLARWEGLQRQVALHEQRMLPLARDRAAAALAAYRAGGELRPWLEATRAELDVHLGHAEHLAELGRAWAALAFLLPEHTP
ncbi:MAG: TolC family protein [Proteobacteria bacterium]|nr:TolC family protein [Pseudomonadota bacterium]MBS0598854.1 TolC family protein [Pseudomonadota bacterium]